MTPSKLRARPFVAGFGGVGPATQAPHPDAWVVMFVDVETTGKVSGVEVKEIELVDHAGKVVARGVPPWSLRRDSKTSDDERRRLDFSEVGTTPFDGEAQPGQELRLYLRAPLDARLKELMSAQPARFRARVLASEDAGIWVEGPLQGAWPTAGPAAPR